MEPKERKMQIGLSIKQVGAEPWEDFPAFIAEGLVVNGKVTRLEKFGAFVELSPGIEGLIPMSEMSFTKRVMHAEDVLRAGEKVNVLVKDVNRPARRISLSLKEAGDDPWAPVASKYPVGTIVEGVVEKREAFGLFVRLEEGVVGLLPKSKALESSEFPFDKLRHGDKVKVRVLEIRRDERRMTLCPPEGGEGEDWRNFVSTAASGSTTGAGFGTLADKLKAALEKKSK
jgi:small subunit ribosomal protein S1